MHCIQDRLAKRSRARSRKPTTSLRLSEQQVSEIDRLVRRVGMRSRTEFIEQAIARYLQELEDAKILIVRRRTDQKAKAEVLEYLRGRRSTHVSDIMEALGMEPEQAFRVVDSLIKGERIDRVA